VSFAVYKKYNCLLMLDDAHVEVMGNGKGTVEYYKCLGKVAII